MTTAYGNIYLKVEGPGQYIVTDEARGESYVKVVETARESREQQNVDKIQTAIEVAAAKFDFPQSLIFSMVRAYQETDGTYLMPLPARYIENHGDTVLNNPRRNIIESTRYFQEMLKDFDGNLTLALAAHFAGPDRVRSIGGIPPDSNAGNYIDNVQNFFDEFETRSAVIYTYRDKDGTLHVVNIR